MSFSSIKKRFLGHGEGVEFLKASLTKKVRRTGPVHGLHQLSQREQLNKLLGREEDSLKSQPQSNHPTAKDHTVTFSFVAMQCDDYIFF